ncbi:oxygen-dependent coproporphyrinogen oxidase [Pelagibacterales bacterium]|nr:oxygen-dependent coproporphyrinogen oxidase [Pelagibacterales bacterium]
MIEKQKIITKDWFEDLRKEIIKVFLDIENNNSRSSKKNNFNFKKWKRKSGNTKDNGGGTMGILYGDVFEKVGVNVSTVHGKFSSKFKKQIPGAGKSGKFWASGISVVAHMNSPFIPSFHFNTRFIVTESSWFGGGMDMTPAFKDIKNKNTLHQNLKKMCDMHNKKYYKKFSKECDEYFYLPHRKETRGDGGIFFDRLNTKRFENDFAFVKDTGKSFIEIVPKIILRNIKKKWTKDDKRKQEIKRGRYAEFNLLYDRGTKFGLETDGNIDAILMSMPPKAIWK